MIAKQNLPQTLASQKSGLRALELYFFEFLPALAFKLGFGKRSFAREFVHETKQRLGEFAQARERDRAGVLPGAGRKVGAEPPQIFLELAANAICRSRAHYRRGDVVEDRLAMRI